MRLEPPNNDSCITACSNYSKAKAVAKAEELEHLRLASRLGRPQVAARPTLWHVLAQSAPIQELIHAYCSHNDILKNVSTSQMTGRGDYRAAFQKPSTTAAPI